MAKPTGNSVQRMSLVGKSGKARLTHLTFRLAPDSGPNRGHIGCPKPDFDTAAKSTLFDHLVGAGKQRWWDRKTERSRRT
jgi:hypothetical protein